MIIPPIQKAEELFDKFFALYPDQDAYWIAKEGALFSVDEIIESRKEAQELQFQLFKTPNPYNTINTQIPLNRYLSIFYICQITKKKNTKISNKQKAILKPYKET